MNDLVLKTIDDLASLDTEGKVVEYLVQCHGPLGFDSSRYYDVHNSPNSEEQFLILRDWAGSCPGVKKGQAIYEGPVPHEKLRTGSPVWVTERELCAQSGLEQWEFIKEYELKAWVTIPLRANENFLGFWSISRANEQKPEDAVLQAITRIAHLAGLKIYELRQSQITLGTKAFFSDLHYPREGDLGSYCVEEVCMTTRASFAALFMVDPVKGGFRKEVEVYYDGEKCHNFSTTDCDARYSENLAGQCERMLNIPDFPKHRDEFSHLMSGDSIACHEKTMGRPIASILYHVLNVPGARRGLLRIINRVDEPELSFNAVHEVYMALMAQPIAHIMAVQNAKASIKALGNAFQTVLAEPNREGGHSGCQGIAHELQRCGFPYLILTIWNEDGSLREFWTNHDAVKAGLGGSIESIKYPAIKEITGPAWKTAEDFPSSLCRVMEEAGIRATYVVPSQEDVPERFSPETVLAIIPLSMASDSNGQLEAHDKSFWGDRPNLLQFLAVSGQLAGASVRLGRARKLLYLAGQAIGNIGHELRAPASALQSVGQDVALKTKTLLEQFIDQRPLVLDLTNVGGDGRSRTARSEDASEILQWVNQQNDKIVYHSHFLDKVVNDSIRWARMGGQVIEVHFEKISLHKIMRDCVEGLSNEISREPGLKVSIRDNVKAVPPFAADPFDLHVLFTNLIDNAIKYSWRPGRGHKDTIEIFANPEQDCVDVHIRNWGIGIKDADYENIFSSFYRAQVRDEVHTVRGVGLGLPTCKRIAEIHGGDIRVISVPTLGDKVRTQKMEGFQTTFTVRLSTKLKVGRYDVQNKGC